MFAGKIWGIRTTESSGNDMGDTVEKEEFRDDEGFDQHDKTGSNHR